MSDDRRMHPSKVAGDRASLTAFLDYQRATLAMKCQGLTGAQLRQKAVPTSGLSLLGLVRHAAEVERSWFRMVLNGERCEALWPRIDGEFTEFHVEDADVAEAFAFWHEACEGSRAAADAVESLEDTVDFRGEIISLRYVLTHMIEEYARHNGHADLLREAIDGEVGE
ncbi:Mini-circle protein [Streptomyces sp. WM4235]|uniref:DinB family protein n=1 Tax=unclassified Streptomyces TaxID=2593676 RepID=UPI0006AF3691|nr:MULTISPECIES: DinB family protein [unclassified Streptomyces]KOU39183.1 Mini-circle protein [Streptomyces sp. WM4235]MCX5078023.1 DinB family protein [Streptomyces sp. NBC_00424]